MIDMSAEESLKYQLEQAQIEYDEIRSNAPSGMSYVEYTEYMKPVVEKVSTLSRLYRMKQTPYFEWIESDPDNDIMSIQEFLEAVRIGLFSDYDGHGKYIRNNQISNIDIYPSDVATSSIRNDFDTIIWFNR